MIKAYDVFYENCTTSGVTSKYKVPEEQCATELAVAIADWFQRDNRVVLLIGEFGDLSKLELYTQKQPAFFTTVEDYSNGFARFRGLSAHVIIQVLDWDERENLAQEECFDVLYACLAGKKDTAIIKLVPPKPDLPEIPLYEG